MSRHGYNEDCDGLWAMIRWQGAVASAIRGRRGQALLRRMAEALDAMPDKRLIAGDVVREDGSCCALGAIAKREGINVGHLDPEDADKVAITFNVAPALAREVTYQNDDFIRPLRVVREGGYYESPDGKQFSRYARWAYEGKQDDLKLVPVKYRDPSAEELEANEEKHHE